MWRPINMARLWRFASPFTPRITSGLAMGASSSSTRIASSHTSAEESTPGPEKPPNPRPSPTAPLRSLLASCFAIFD